MKHPTLFTFEEYKELTVLACGRNGATKEQILFFIEQCEDMRLGTIMLEMLRSGKIEVVGYTENDFMVAPKGIA